MNTLENVVMPIIKSLNLLNINDFKYNEISNRRGVLVSKITIEGNQYILKAAVDSKDESIDKEKYAYAKLNFLKDLLVSSGNSPCSWLLIKNLDFKSLDKYISKMILNNSSEKLLSEELIRVANLVMKAHENGFIHGDLQPSHFLLSKDSEFLIDWGASLNKNSRIYKGALVHYVSPEVAMQMLQKKDNIEINEVSEVYSLCSVFYFSISGETSTNYGSKNYKSISFEDKLLMVSSNGANGEELKNFKRIYKILQKGLSINKDERYQTIKDLILDLKNI
tara:strand:+ start:3531 stop:4367 length:837 start_codon:yes stop_codon:yes gene_type:complete